MRPPDLAASALSNGRSVILNLAIRLEQTVKLLGGTGTSYGQGATTKLLLQNGPVVVTYQYLNSLSHNVTLQLESFHNNASKAHKSQASSGRHLEKCGPAGRRIADGFRFRMSTTNVILPLGLELCPRHGLREKMCCDDTYGNDANATLNPKP